MEKWQKGLVAIGIALMLIAFSQAVSIFNCPTTTPCSGWDVINPVCQWNYESAVAASSACAAQSWMVSEILFWFGIFLLLYGILRIVL